MIFYKTVSHYFWKMDSDHSDVKVGFSEDEKKYILITCDRLVYEFDVNSGEIIKQYIDKSILPKKLLNME